MSQINMLQGTVALGPLGFFLYFIFVPFVGIYKTKRGWFLI